MTSGTDTRWMQQQLLAQLIDAARKAPDRKFNITDQTGRVVATLEYHNAPARPKDMPRHLRPRERLSKRQRDQAKRAKLEAAA